MQAAVIHPLSRGRKNYHFVLAFFWILGLTMGVVVYCQGETCYFSSMRCTNAGAVSIISLLVRNILPFLISTLAFACSIPALLWSLCFWRAFLFAFVSMGLLYACGTSGWLLRILFLFSDILAVPLLYGFLMSGGKTGLFFRSGIAFLAVSWITMLDYCIVSPILAQLIDH